VNWKGTGNELLIHNMNDNEVRRMVYMKYFYVEESPLARRRTADDDERRNQQLEVANASKDALEKVLKSVHETQIRRKDLYGHLLGFYEEIDKLAKGKTLFEVTPLILQQANDIVRDAKGIGTGDTYLDRIREFVPAGNNPVYPDVLVVMRLVQQGLERCRERLEAREKRILRLIKKARTVAGGLDYYFSEKEVPSKEDLEALVGKVDNSYFSWDENANANYFDLSLLDDEDLKSALSEGEPVENIEGE